MAAGNHNITVIDSQALSPASDRRLDGRPRRSSATAPPPETLIKAGADNADLRHRRDEQRRGQPPDRRRSPRASAARKCIARVHHSRLLRKPKSEPTTSNWASITSSAPSTRRPTPSPRTLRNPGALAIEDFGRGQIQMQELVGRQGRPRHRPAALRRASARGHATRRHYAQPRLRPARSEQRPRGRRHRHPRGQLQFVPAGPQAARRSPRGAPARRPHGWSRHRRLALPCPPGSQLRDPPLRAESRSRRGARREARLGHRHQREPDRPGRLPGGIRRPGRHVHRPRGRR
jgi:hypothetical protein